ncbi:hypothetical protein [Mucilaginibacter kameinonensis]|uniref:hypothetical protein n=1 Tax=Mucilaginibacter kameinonensis TaxID=452286 RepID=UPI0013CE4C2D|nr:hypothetical protein [Mucilaginibacter kameinonensis]
MVQLQWITNPQTLHPEQEVSHETENSTLKNSEQIKPELPKKPALNLEQTLRSVGDLHRLSVQRYTAWPGTGAFLEFDYNNCRVCMVLGN